MKQMDRYKGRKESLGKETDALDPDEYFDVIALMLGPAKKFTTVYSWKCQKCNVDCTSFSELEKRRPISP
jgi:hypothetical protein